MQIEKEKFLFLKINLMLCIRDIKKEKQNVDDLIGRMNNILEVVNEIEFFDNMEKEIFGKKE
jgi:hypothetical protein